MAKKSTLVTVKVGSTNTKKVEAEKIVGKLGGHDVINNSFETIGGKKYHKIELSNGTTTLLSDNDLKTQLK